MKRIAEQVCCGAGVQYDHRCRLSMVPAVEPAPRDHGDPKRIEEARVMS